MSTSRTVGMVAVCIVAAFLVVAAVMPTIDRLQDPKLVLEDNVPDYYMSEPEGYEATVTVVSVELPGVPSATYEVEEGEETRELVLEGYDTLLWAFGDGYVLLTSTGIRTPDGALMGEPGDFAEFSAGSVAAGGYAATYGSVAVPSETGDLGHYRGGFRVTGGGELQAYNFYGTASGTSSGVPGWTLDAEAGEGNRLVLGAEDSDGQAAIGFVAPVGYYAVDEAEGFASAIMDVVPLVLLLILLAYAFMSFGGGRT